MSKGDLSLGSVLWYAAFAARFTPCQWCEPVFFWFGIGEERWGPFFHVGITVN